MEWSKNFAIINPVEQKLPTRNNAPSPPNALYVDVAQGGIQPYFQVSNQSPTQSFNLVRFSLLPVTDTPNAPIFFNVVGYPADGSAAFTRRYKWAYDSQLQYYWKVDIPNFNFVKKVAIWVFDANQKNLPFTLDDVSISWKNPPGSKSDMQQPIIQHQGL